MIIDDYIDYTIKYKEKYGDKTIIFMQVGSFFELYSIDADDTDIYKIADICNIQISRKNKTIQEVSRNNPLMCGFPLYVLNKFSGLLLQNNYTIILVEQVTEPPNPYREVTEILSPGMNLIPVNKKSNYMIVIYCEIINNYLILGISGVDLSTGHSFVYEAGSTKQDPSFATDEAYRIIAAYNPCELVFISNEKLPDTVKDNILKILNTNNILIHKKWENYENIKELSKISYQIGILEKSYSNKKSLISIIEILNLEKYNIARISFCCLIQFAYEHNSDIIKELNPPEILENDKILTIEYNSALQLNLISLNSTEKPLLDILNRCSTPFGTRAFKERLLNPIINTIELNKRYDEIEYLLENDKFKKMNKILNNILDLERIKRRMIVNKFPPMDWCSFNISLEYAIEALELLGNEQSFHIINKINTVRQSYKDIINLDLASKYNLNDIKGTVFYEGIYNVIDNLDIEYKENYKKISDICNKITDLNKDGDATSCKLDYNDRDGYYISITKKRYDTALLKDRDFIIKFDKKSLSASSNILKLTNKIITTASNNIERIQTSISSMVLEEYKKFVANFINNNNDILESIIVFLTSLDISCCNAKNAYEFRYYRPNIVNKSASYIECKNIRHPIIERIDDRVPYIGNDIIIGSGSGSGSDTCVGNGAESYNGMLLYGINASGKSSFMKTLGLNIIMAQAGMYVAASNFVYQPYHHIFTRISGMDNIYKGMSSFTVEMTELRNILQRCTKYSLVLGDELCCGTESTSALSIVAAGIDTLIKKNVSFIFATHLHELVSLEIIKKYINKELYIGHMHITIEPTTNRIIYERKIKDGKGSSIYGLEVCKSLDMPYDFMRIAEDIRKEVQGLNQNVLTTNKSKYNNELYMTECGVCGNPAIDTHHINYQSEADDEGYFKDFHKNVKHNLVPLCKECHIKEHTNKISIKGYSQTSEGIILNVDNNIIDNNPILSQSSQSSSQLSQSEDDNKFDFNNNINVIDTINYDNLKIYIRRGKKNWYIRTKKTSAFRKNTNDKKIIDMINKLEECNITYIDDKIYNNLFDPSL